MLCRLAQKRGIYFEGANTAGLCREGDMTWAFACKARDPRHAAMEEPHGRLRRRDELCLCS